MKGGTPLVPGLTDRVTGGGGWPESVWECKQMPAGALGTGGSPVPLMSRQVELTLHPSPPQSYQRPDPIPPPQTHTHRAQPPISQSPRSTQQLLLFRCRVQSGQCSPLNAGVCGRMCGSLKIPICCPWLSASGAVASDAGRELLRLFPILVDFHVQGLEGVTYLCKKWRHLFF